MRLRRLLCILGLTATALAQQSGQPLPMDTGRPGIEQMLTKLRTTARLMQITAHPDDEDGSMMALESRGHGDLKIRVPIVFRYSSFEIRI